MNIAIRTFVALAIVVFLVSCQSTSKDQFTDSGFHITDVQVSMPDQTETHKALQYTDKFGVMLDNTISHYAYEYNATRANPTKSYQLNVKIEKVHFKNALASLLVGDANHMSGSASLIDRSTGQQVHSAEISYVDSASAALNGISGAVLSVVVKKQAAEGTLSKGFAGNTMRKFFPSVKLSKPASDRLKSKTVYQTMTRPMSPLSVSDSQLPSEEPEVASPPAS